MFALVLFEPEIPPNTGNIIRLCANTGVQLHLVEPLGFSLDDRQLRRAGLDYHEYTTLRVHPTWTDCLAVLDGRRLFAATTHGTIRYTDAAYQKEDVLIFGSETRGLPSTVLANIPSSQRVRLPMRPHSRSLNLSNAAAVMVYEAWRQIGFSDGI